jgi:hypothetical protein
MVRYIAQSAETKVLTLFHNTYFFYFMENGCGRPFFGLRRLASVVTWPPSSKIL